MKLERIGDGSTGLEVEDGQIHVRLRGSRTPRSMPCADCSGVSLSMAPTIGAMGTALRYHVALLGREGHPDILIGDTPSLVEARNLWRHAADQLQRPAVMSMPNGMAMDRGTADAPPAGIAVSNEGGRPRITIRRGKLEYAFVATLATGLAVILVFGVPSADNAFFMVLAAGLLGYALIAGLSSRFIKIADGSLTAGLHTPLGESAKVEMPLAEIETVLWGKAENRLGKSRAAFVMATADKAKSFDRLTDDQARWLTRFVTRNSGTSK